TSDHGMPFPFVKGQIHEDGFHLPLAMRWGKGIKPGRVVEDFVNVRDFAPTYLELAGVPIHAQITGRSLVDIIRSPKSGQNDPAFTPIMADLKTRMLDMLLEEKDPRALGNGAIFDTYKYVAGRAKAYDTWLKAQGQKLADTDLKAKPKAKKGDGE